MPPPIRLFLRRCLSLVQRRIYPVGRGGLGACARCGRPWPFCRRHTTRAGRYAVAPLCEDCWAELSPFRRLPYYEGELAAWKAEVAAKPHLTFPGDCEEAVLWAVADGK